MAQFMDRSDLQMLKDYVRAPGNFGANQAESTVLIHITHSNLKAEFLEIRLDKHVRSPTGHGCNSVQLDFESSESAYVSCYDCEERVIVRNCEAQSCCNAAVASHTRGGGCERQDVHCWLRT